MNTYGIDARFKTVVAAAISLVVLLGLSTTAFADNTFNFEKEIAGSSAAAPFKSLDMIDLDGEGRVYSVDPLDKKLEVFDSFKAGNAPLQSQTDVKVTNGQDCNKDGAPDSNKLGDPFSVTVEPGTGMVYVFDKNLKRIVKYSSLSAGLKPVTTYCSSSLNMPKGNLAGIESFGPSRLYVTIIAEGGLFGYLGAVDIDKGISLDSIQRIWYPYNLSTDSAGNLDIANFNSDRVELWKRSESSSGGVSHSRIEDPALIAHPPPGQPR